MNQHLTFFSTINHVETKFQCDMTQNYGAKLQCVVVEGIHKGETRLFPTLSLMTLWDQQNDEGEAA